MEKSSLRFVTFFHEENVYADKFANLDFIHKEYFYWYNKLPYNIFLGFFINRYKLPMYHFC